MRLIIQGYVQGVGFRATAKHYAKNLGLTGTVRNLSDGSVEIFVVGSKEHIEQFIESLRNQFPKEYISNIIQEEILEQHTFEDFRIIS